MNDAELELLARRAAETVRDEADRIANSRSALADVLGGRRSVARAADDDRADVIDVVVDRQRRRSPWVPILAAAAVIAAVAGIVLAVRDDGPDQIVVTTEPERPDDTVDETVDDADVAVVGTVPDTVPGSSAPDTTAAIPIDEVVVVPDEIGPPLTRRVLATYAVGDGPGELGFEDCRECEPVVPWAPVVTGDLTVYVADVWNGRWQLFRDGEWASLPFRAGEIVVASPVVGPDGLIYAAVADALAPVNQRRVVAYEADLTATETYDVATGGVFFGSVDLVGGDALRYGYSEVRRFDLPLGSATWGVDGETREVSLALSGVFRQFRLPTTWGVSDHDATALDDGSVVLHAWVQREQEGPLDWFLVRLWPDGRWATGTIGTRPITTGLDGRFSRTGFVQLETGEIVEYAYPSDAGAGDAPLTGWRIPDVVQASLDDLPRLAPGRAVPGATRSLRSEWASSPAAPAGYEQVWVRSTATRSVDAVLQIVTDLRPLPVDGDVEVEVPGWERASFVRTIDAVVSLRLHDGGRTVTVWATGLERDEVTAIASTLAVDDDLVGWDPTLPEPDRWTPVHEGWSGATASRSVTQRDAGDSILLELVAQRGAPGSILTPGVLDTAITLDELDGRPALLFDDGSRTAVTWSPSDEVVVVLGSYRPLDELVDVARSLVDLDPADWAAIPTDPTDDGCNGMFC
jgi:hypothetical protein